MAGVFDLKRSTDQFMFNLKSAENGQTVLTSERYTSKQSAKNGIESVMANAASDGRYQRKTAKDGSPYFNLTATNGQIIGTSERYSSEAARDKGIEWVKANAPGATVKDNT